MIAYVLIPVLTIGMAALTQLVCWMVPADRMDES